MLANDDTFNASTATQWKLLQTQSDTSTSHPIYYRNIYDHSTHQDERLKHRDSRLTAYFALQSVSAQISDLQGCGKLQYESTEFLEICSSLNSWYCLHELGNQLDSDPLGLSILWHATFMNLLADFDKLERALGRDGRINFIDSDVSYARQWSNSISADRCILHAQAIDQLVSKISLNTDPATHVAHCVFQAGIAAYSAMHFRRISMPLPPIPRAVSNFPEFNLGEEFSKGI